MPAVSGLTPLRLWVPICPSPGRFLPLLTPSLPLAGKPRQEPPAGGSHHDLGRARHERASATTRKSSSTLGALVAIRRNAALVVLEYVFACTNRSGLLCKSRQGLLLLVAGVTMKQSIRYQSACKSRQGLLLASSRRHRATSWKRG